MCKGRLFAEKETFMFMAAFISCWDIEYLGPKDSAGNWLIKKGRQGGAALPAGEVRVSMMKRKTERSD